MKFGRDKDGDLWCGPFMWKPVEREQNHGDRSTTTRIHLWWVTRWHMQIEFTKGWR